MKNHHRCLIAVCLVGFWLITVAASATPPEKTTLRTPEGTVSAGDVSFSWDAVDGASRYRFWLSRDGVAYDDTWIEGQTAWTLTLAGGEYEYWVRTWGSDGYGPWSDGLSFTVSEVGTPPGVASLSSPSGTVASARPVFIWQAATNATWYRVYINRNDVYHWQKWTQEATWTPWWNMTDYPGNYEWWVRTWGAGGYGPWSNSLTFTIGHPPETTVLRNPMGTVTAGSVIFSWDTVENATWYFFWLNKGGTPYDNAWVEGTTTRVLPLDAGEYQYWVRTWGNAGYGPWSAPATFTVAEAAIAQSLTTSTQCAEEDNVNVPIMGDYHVYTIEVTHPRYAFSDDHCAPNFDGCPATEPGYAFTPRTTKLFDDGQTVVEAVTEANWWLPEGMDLSVDTGTPVKDVHYLRLYRKIAGANEWPQFLVLYADGNLRLIPHPPTGRSSVCFGSSVVIGPASTGARPCSDIVDVRYLTTSDKLEFLHANGIRTRIDVEEVNRTRSRVRVAVDTSTELPNATFRSMFVALGNADVDHVSWQDVDGNSQKSPVMEFSEGRGKGWFFSREAISVHNTSAPDTRITIVE